MGRGDGVGRRVIARAGGRWPLLLALVLTIAGTLAAPAAADSFNTRAASHIVASSHQVELRLESFNLHRGNSLCPDMVRPPDLVGPAEVRGFCFEAKGLLGPGSHDTEFSFRYFILLRIGQKFIPSGYVLVGHARIIEVGTEDNELSCGIEKYDSAAATEHFDCQVTTQRDAKRSRDPAPAWKLSYTATPNLPHVIFIGDSVTAGFGYCGDEGGRDSANIKCKRNDSIADSWKGENSLQACAPDEAVMPVNDRCSNNNSLGAPWNAGPWFPDRNAPSVAYPYVIAKNKSGALVYDWAMTGSTPADWDPVTGGAFANQTKSIKDSYVVMTLGANPLLAAYLKITIFDYPKINGACADTTGHLNGARTGFVPAPLDNQKDGVLRCFNEKWDSLHQGTHLLNLYKTLLANGNHVLVLGYPVGCPWDFGNWQTQIGVSPSKGHACSSLFGPSIRGGVVSQFGQALALDRQLNDRIEAVVTQAAASVGGQGKIFFALPDQAAWAQHQAWSDDPWVFKNDTWVHPNVAGHTQLAATVLTAICRRYKHWCGTPPKW